jgi:cysteinyl-tRNA synthetase
MFNDINSPLALTIFFKMLRFINKKIDRKEFSYPDLKYTEEIIHELGDFFQIIPALKKIELPEEAKKLIEEREIERKKGNYEKADEIRRRLEEEFGIILEDTPEGVKWKLK